MRFDSTSTYKTLKHRCDWRISACGPKQTTFCLFPF